MYLQWQIVRKHAYVLEIVVMSDWPVAHDPGLTKSDFFILSSMLEASLPLSWKSDQ